MLVQFLRKYEEIANWIRKHAKHVLVLCSAKRTTLTVAIFKAVDVTNLTNQSEEEVLYRKTIQEWTARDNRHTV